jgi:DNA-binding beta-propeller fold protein YncE
MTVDNTYLYVAYEDNTLLGEIFTLNNPLATTTEIFIPSGVTEYPVDIAIDDTYIYFLLPGILSGTNTQILKYDLAGNYIQTLDLSESSNIVTNAKSMTIDSVTGDIWIATYESPANLVRVYQVRVIA